MDDEDKGGGPVNDRRSWLWRRPRWRFLLGIPAGGLIALFLGAGALGAFNYTMEATNTLEFCTGCHVMEAHIYPTYAESTHYQNPSGVRVVCADCHVPSAWWPKLGAKVNATFKEVPSWVTGRIATEEKYEAHRYTMAERVWERMRANDSRECRDCHSFDAMTLAAQSRQAQRRHSPEWLERTGDTCIDCHQGVVHDLPNPPDF